MHIKNLKDKERATKFMRRKTLIIDILNAVH